jgi:hypothetical protein
MSGAGDYDMSAVLGHPSAPVSIRRIGAVGGGTGKFGYFDFRRWKEDG